MHTALQAGGYRNYNLTQYSNYSCVQKGMPNQQKLYYMRVISQIHTQELLVRLTDETDPFFLYTLALGEADFQGWALPHLCLKFILNKHSHNDTNVYTFAELIFVWDASRSDIVYEN